MKKKQYFVLKDRYGNETQNFTIKQLVTGTYY